MLNIKHDVSRGNYLMKKFYKSLKKDAMKVINFEKKKIIPLTDEEHKSYASEEYCHMFGKKIQEEDTDENKRRKNKDHCYYTDKCRDATHSISRLKVYIKK